MALEKFDRNAIGYITNPTVSPTRGYWLRINKVLALQLRSEDTQFATFYFDAKTNSVEVEFSVERPSWYKAIIGGTNND